MRALVKSRAEPGLWLEDVPEPEHGINDVLIKVPARSGARPAFREADRTEVPVRDQVQGLGHLGEEHAVSSRSPSRRAP